MAEQFTIVTNIPHSLILEARRTLAVQFLDHNLLKGDTNNAAGQLLYGLFLGAIMGEVETQAPRAPIPAPSQPEPPEMQTSVAEAPPERPSEEAPPAQTPQGDPSVEARSKRRKSEWTPQRRAAQAERMRATNARLHAQRQEPSPTTQATPQTPEPEPTATQEAPSESNATLVAAKAFVQQALETDATLSRDMMLTLLMSGLDLDQRTAQRAYNSVLRDQRIAQETEDKAEIFRARLKEPAAVTRARLQEIEEAREADRNGREKEAHPCPP